MNLSIASEYPADLQYCLMPSSPQGCGLDILRLLIDGLIPGQSTARAVRRHRLDKLIDLCVD